MGAEELQREIENLSNKLRKQIQKYPSTGKSFFSGLKNRYFAIKMNMDTVSDPEMRKAPASLCYWEDEKASQKEDPLGIVPVVSIMAVGWKADIEKGLQVKIITS